MSGIQTCFWIPHIKRWGVQEMKLGLLSAILAEQNFREVIDLCEQIGYEAVEVACWPRGKAKRRYAGVTHLEIAEGKLNQVEKELQYARDKGIEISAFGYYPNPMSRDQEERQMAITHIKELIHAANVTGVGMVNTFIGRDKEKTVEENLAIYKEIWSPILELAEKENVKIAIENCPMLFSRDEWPGGNNLASTPAIWEELFRLIDSNKLGINYDPSHCVILDMDYLKPIYQFKDRIFHVHLKDTHIIREKLNEVGRLSYPLDYMTPKLPGLGDIDWAAFCSSLYEIGYQGIACVEMEDRAFETSEEMIRKGIQLAYRNMRQYV